MANGDGAAARAYHAATNHSVASLQRNQHVLDWENQPLPYKIYLEVPPIPLAEGLADEAAADRIPSRRELARLLLHAAGVVRKVTYAGGRTLYFRAAACTGALYHVDVYVVCAALSDLEAGVYHFSPHDFALRRLRAGDQRGALVAASDADPAVAGAPVVLACASTFWRNAWKYQARAYRHVFWDTGTILANLLAVASADGVAARLVLGFVDATVNALLGLDGEREAPVALVALGTGAAAPPPAPADEPLALATAPLSEREIDYPAIRTMHAATTLASPRDVAAWRAALPTSANATPPTVSPADRVPLPDTPLAQPPITTVIRRRGSTRVFARGESIDAAALATMLRTAVAAIPADVTAPAPIDAYCIVHAVDGIPPGAYVLAPEGDALLRLAPGDFRREAGHLDLGQELAADASVNVYFLADLEPFYRRFGDRGYRVAQLLAAIMGGRVYLTAYALGLGATGLTFFDDDVVAFFSPHARGKQVMFLVAVGRPRRR
jgi:SagB-type dehydrogenase family enzyme